jgi:hypothetical protein
LAQYIHNSWTSSTTKKTPFDLLELAEEAGFNLENPSILYYFWKGLPANLLSRCLESDPAPNSWATWKDTAQRKWLNQGIVFNILHQQGRLPPPNRPWPFRGRSIFKEFKPPPGLPPGHNGMPMDVDSLHKVTTEKEKAEYMKQGCCFKCGRQRHMVRACPICQKKRGGAPAQIKVTETQEIERSKAPADTSPAGIMLPSTA